MQILIFFVPFNYTVDRPFIKWPNKQLAIIVKETNYCGRHVGCKWRLIMQSTITCSYSMYKSKGGRRGKNAVGQSPQARNSEGSCPKQGWLGTTRSIITQAGFRVLQQRSYGSSSFVCRNCAKVCFGVLLSSDWDPFSYAWELLKTENTIINIIR